MAQKLSTIVHWHGIGMDLVLFCLPNFLSVIINALTLSDLVFKNCRFLCLVWGKKKNRNTVKSRHTFRKPWDHLKPVNHAVKTVITVSSGPYLIPQSIYTHTRKRDVLTHAQQQRDSIDFTVNLKLHWLWPALNNFLYLLYFAILLKQNRKKWHHHWASTRGSQPILCTCCQRLQRHAV